MTELITKMHESKEDEEQCPMCSRYLCRSCFVTKGNIKICNDCHLKTNQNMSLLLIITFTTTLVVTLTIILALIF